MSRGVRGGLPVVRQDPVEPAFVQNPYPFYARARRMGPLVWWEDYGLACATTHDAVHALLRDRRFGREVPTEHVQPVPAHCAAFYAVEAHSMLELEAPRHTRLRGLVLRAFTTRRIRSLEPEIAALAHDLIDRFPAGDFDLLPAFCQEIPVIVICRLLGVPEAMAPQLLRWSADMVAMYQARRDRAVEERAAAAAAAFSAFLHEHVARRRHAPADDLITQLIAAEEDGARLSTDELITTCILLLNAGHEATVHSLGNAVKAVLETGTAVDAQTAGAIAEEALRFDPPLHMFTRFAYEPVEAFGHRFARGDEVALLLGAATRDPAFRADPDRFDPEQADQGHVAFGGGPHFCVGAPLARLEMRVALPILFDRCPGLRLVGTPRYADLYHFHGLDQLRVRI